MGSKYGLPKSILDKRKCVICENHKTYVNKKGRHVWFREYDSNGNWTGCYLCYWCNGKIYQKNDPNSQNNIMKSTRNVRVGNIKKDSEQGLVVITQAVVAKVHKIEDLNIKMDNYDWYIDMESGDYGKINVEYSSLKYHVVGLLKYELWKFNNKKNRICDTYILLCFNEDKSDIERIYIIPRNIIDVAIIGIYINGSKYEKFRVDKKEYSYTYCDLMFYLEDKEYFGIEDIKEWMNL